MRAVRYRGETEASAEPTAPKLSADELNHSTELTMEVPLSRILPKGVTREGLSGKIEAIENISRVIEVAIGREDFEGAEDIRTAILLQIRDPLLELLPAWTEH